MKKIVIFLSVVILAIAALPMIGNSVIQSEINEKIAELQKFGLESKNVQKDSGYLSTSQHFEFLLKDADTFVEYINKYADGQIPPYVNAMLEGVLVGVDLKYCNLPFSKSIELDIYPLSLSPSMTEELKEENLAFYEHLEKFLHSKGILYHINYNIFSQDFSGFIKDIDEKYTLADKTELLLKLKDTTFEGNGELIAPNAIASSVKELRLEIKQETESVVFDLLDLQTTTSYASRNTYLSSGELASLDFSVKGEEDVQLLLKDIKVNVSSNTQGEFAEVSSKSSAQNLALRSDDLNFDIKNFNVDLAVNGLDKESFEESTKLLSKLNNLEEPRLEKELQDSLEKLFAKGFVFSVADFSAKDIVLQKTEELKGFKVQIQITLKEDKDFARKLEISPLLLISNIDVATKVRLSKEIYAKLTQYGDVPEMVQEFLKEDGNDYVFEIDYKDGETTLNGKALR